MKLGMRRYNAEFPGKQYRNSGSDGRYGFVYYPELGNVRSPRDNSRLIRKYRYQHGTENFGPDSNPMSESSQGIASTTSSFSSVKSRGERDPEGEEIKNAEVIPGEVKNQKNISSICFEEVLGESDLQKKQQNAKMNREKKIVSVLSPFAKVFVPGVNITTPTNEMKAALEETKDENIRIAELEQLVCLKI